jgi:archaellum component FlaC
MNSHLVNVLEKVGELSLSVMKLKAGNDDLRKQNKEKDKKIDRLEKRVAKLESAIYVNDDIERDGLSKPDSFHRGGVGTLCVRDGDSRLVQKSPKYQIGLYEPTDQIQFPSGVSHMLQESMEKHGNQISRLHESVQGMQQSITQYSIAVDELRLRQDVQDVKTTHGVFIWKIPDIRRRYRDALDRKTISLYSPPFQTSPHGYRMCVRVYLNGDGSGKGTYISVFFVLMRSEHDDLLNFPFKQSVRFTLVNQSNHAESVTEAFAPDLKSQSFQKPEGEMNVASGFPKFARQSVLHDERFTKGNVIYVKAQVDLAGLTLE